MNKVLIIIAIMAFCVPAIGNLISQQMTVCFPINDNRKSVYIGPSFSYNTNFLKIPILVGDEQTIDNEFPANGFTVGLNYEYLLGASKFSTSSLHGGIYYRRINSTRLIKGDVDIENNIDLSYLVLDADYSLMVMGSPFRLITGFSFNFLTDDDSQILLSSDNELPDSRSYTKTSDTNAEMLLDPSPFQLFWKAGICYDLNFPGFVIRPQLQYLFALNNGDMLKSTDFIDFKVGVVFAF